MVAGYSPHEERERLLVAFAELVAERGYGSTTVEQVVDRAGVDRPAFERWFAGKRDCLLAASATAAGRAFGAAAEAYLAAPESWPEAARNALDGLLTFAAGSPALARLCVLEAARMDEHSGDRALELFMAFLEPAQTAGPSRSPRSRLTAEMVAGGLFELIRTHAAEQRLEDLPEALPVATVLALTPFVGGAEARRIAETPGGSP